jgi:hypothetical protein
VGDIILDDGVSSFTTTIQSIPATANRVISFQDATGIVALTSNISVASIVTTTANSYTLSGTDIGRIIEFNNLSNATVTLPNNSTVSLSIGSQFTLVSLTTSTVNVAPASSVTLLSRGNVQTLAGQYAAAFLYKRDTDTWVMTGDIV